MAKVYRTVGITVGMGEYPTNFTTPVIDVMTENDIAQLLIDFPPRYSTYRKIIDIGYITSSEVYAVETYELTYSDELEHYVFLIGRKFAYCDKVYMQFRCQYPDGQESVDPAILKLKFRPALRIDDFISYENNDLQTQSEILEELIAQHASVNASTTHTGHVAIDNNTIKIDSNGVISADFATLLNEASTNMLGQNPTQFLTNVPGDIYTNKTIIDDDGFVHGIFDYPDLSNYSRLMYYTNRNDYTVNKARIFPKKLASITEAFPSSVGGTSNWIGRDIYNQQYGSVMQFDFSTLPENVEIIRAGLGVDIKAIDYGYNPIEEYYEYFPKVIEVRLIGENVLNSSLSQVKFVSISSPESESTKVSVWNDGGNSLFEFDLSSLPTNSAVITATLILTVTGTTDIADRDVTIHHINSQWISEIATWGTLPDYDVTPIATFQEAEVGEIIRIDLTTEIYGIQTGSLTNYGWYMKYESEVLPTYSGEGHQLNFADPQLEISLLIPTTDWSPSTVSWNSIHSDIFTSTIGTFAATGPFNRSYIDITNVVKEWLAHPTINNGLYLSTVSGTTQGVNIFLPMSGGIGNDYSGQIPRLVVEYSNEETVDPGKDVWTIIPIFSGNNVPFSCADIAIGPEGDVNIIYTASEYLGTSPQTPLEKGPAITGYLNIKINGEERIIDSIDAFESNIDFTKACRDPKITEVNTGTVYAFIKKLPDDELSPRAVEVYANTGTMLIFTEEEDSIYYSTEIGDVAITIAIGTEVNYYKAIEGKTVQTYNLGTEGEQYTRNYLQFDISSIPSTPSGLYISSVKLDTTMYAVTMPNSEIGIYHVTGDWNQDDITWLTMPSYSYLIAGFQGEEGHLSVDITDEILGMMNSSIENHGWMFRYIDETYGTNYQVSFYDITLFIVYSKVARYVPWALEYTTSITVPSVYEYAITNTNDYMGGEAVSYGENAYFAYISHYQTQEINPDSGYMDYCLIFQVKLLSKIDNVWNEEVIYEFDPMFHISGYYSTYMGLSYTTYSGTEILRSGAKGYPFNPSAAFTLADNFPDEFKINIAVRNDSDISIIFPTWSRYDSSGVPDLLIARYDGTSWTIKDLRINDWDTGSRTPEVISTIMPESIVYDSNNQPRIAYTPYTLTTYSASGEYIINPVKYAKFDSKKWVFLDKIADKFVSSEFLFGRDLNLVKLNSGKIISIYKTQTHTYDAFQVSLIKKYLYE
jgi:hypothetical protein